MRDNFAKVLYRVGKENPKIAIVVADISPAGSMASFREEFPMRFINVGVAEQNMIGMCAGMALRGLRPFAYTIATFTIYRPFEMIRDDLCYQNLPVTVVGIGGGINYSTLGGTHHAQEDIAIMSALPNMTIIAPCDPAEVEAATIYCATQSNSPVYLRLGKAGEPNLTEKATEPWCFGKIRTIRQGSKRCILTYGPITKMAVEAALEVETKTGDAVEVVSVSTLKPLDTVGIKKVLSTFKKVLVLEEHSIRGGLGAQVKELAWDSKVSTDLKTIGLKDEFIHVYGNYQQLLAAHGITKEKIVESLL